MRSTGRIVSRDEISVVLYQRKSTPYERSLDVHVSHLRKKIEKNEGPLIRTIRGIGYVMTEGDA
jgi:two-component system, OmpR family, response regulator CpxR